MGRRPGKFSTSLRCRVYSLLRCRAQQQSSAAPIDLGKSVIVIAGKIVKMEGVRVMRASRTCVINLPDSTSSVNVCIKPSNERFSGKNNITDHTNYTSVKLALLFLFIFLLLVALNQIV